MEKTADNIIGILKIIDLLSEWIEGGNLEYIEHYLTEIGTYKVILSDGSTIEIHRLTAEDAEYSIESITEETLSHIISTLKRPEQ